MNMGLFGTRGLGTGPAGRGCWCSGAFTSRLRIGVGVAFTFGLFMDVHQGALLGQHALAYTALGFLGDFHAPPPVVVPACPTQAVQVLPLFVAAHLLELLVRLATGGRFPGWSYLLAPLVEAALWPVVSVLLLAPQRRAPIPDDNRPL